MDSLKTVLLSVVVITGIVCMVLLFEIAWGKQVRVNTQDIITLDKVLRLHNHDGRYRVK